MVNLASKFRSYVKFKLFPILCQDCKIKVARKLGFVYKVKGRLHRHRHRGHKVAKGSKRYKQLLRNLAKARRARRK